MKTVEIICRYWSPGAPTRPRPHDAESARLRLSDGNHAFATLLDGLSQGAGLAQPQLRLSGNDFSGCFGRSFWPAPSGYGTIAA